MIIIQKYDPNRVQRGYHCLRDRFFTLLHIFQLMIAGKKLLNGPCGFSGLTDLVLRFFFLGSSPVGDPKPGFLTFFIRICQFLYIFARFSYVFNLFFLQYYPFQSFLSVFVYLYYVFACFYTFSSVYICFCPFLYVFVCFIRFYMLSFVLSVFIWFYLFSSVFICF